MLPRGATYFHTSGILVAEAEFPADACTMRNFKVEDQSAKNLSKLDVALSHMTYNTSLNQTVLFASRHNYKPRTNQPCALLCLTTHKAIPKASNCTLVRVGWRETEYTATNYPSLSSNRVVSPLNSYKMLPCSQASCCERRQVSQTRLHNDFILAGWYFAPVL